MTKKSKSSRESKSSSMMRTFTQKKRALAARRTGTDRRASRETLNLIVLQLPLDMSPFALGEQLVLEGQRAGSFETAGRLLVGVMRLLSGGRDVAAARITAGGESQAARLAAASRTVTNPPLKQLVQSKPSKRNRRP